MSSDKVQILVVDDDIGSMWWIFAPSEEDKQKELQSQGFNTEMPLADGTEIIGDKTKAYELGELEARQQSRALKLQFQTLLLLLRLLNRLRTLNLTYFVIAFGLSQTQLFFTENWMVL